MADFDLGATYKQYSETVSKNNAAQSQNIDRITKLIQSNIPTPSDMVNIVGQVTSPVTKYEVMRGERRPTPAQVIEAGKATEIKNGVGVNDLIQQGTANVAQQMQTAINAINAQAAEGNSHAAPVRNVLQSVLPSLNPDDALLVAQEFLGRLGQESGVTDQTAWTTMSDVLKDTGVKGKTVIPKPVEYQDESGNTVKVFYNPATKELETHVGPPKAPTGNKGYRPLYTEEPQLDAAGNIVGVKKTPTGVFNNTTGTFSQPNIESSTPQTKVVTPPAGYTRTPTGMAAVPGGPGDPNVKESPKEASDQATVQTGLDKAKQLRDELMPGGKVDFNKVRQFATGINGGKTQALFEQAIAGYRHTISGANLTQIEMENNAKGFKPSWSDANPETIKQKLNGLVEQLENDVKARSTARAPKAEAANDKSAKIIQSAKNAVASGKWSKAGAAAKLKELGIAPSELAR